MGSTTLALRVIIAFIGIAVLLLALEMHVEGKDLGCAVYLLIEGALIIGGLLYERQRWLR